MADDIQRYIDGEPLLAQPQTAVYVLKKKIIKHRRKVLVRTVEIDLGLEVETDLADSDFGHGLSPLPVRSVTSDRAGCGTPMRAPCQQQ